MSDPILEEIWRVREKLLREHGGIDGYFKYIQNLDRARLRKAKLRRERKAAKTDSKKAHAV